MTKPELAKALGISRQMVNVLQQRGMPVDDVQAAKEWRRENVQRKRPNGSIGEEVSKLRFQQARIAKLEADEREGLLLDAEDVNATMLELLVFITGQCEALPARCAHQCLGRELPEILAVITDECRQAREDIAAKAATVRAH